MLSHVIFFVVGLIILVKGADYFVEASSRIAKTLGVSEFIIGLTLTSIGTSIPELASSISASLEGHPGLILGNVTGSNIANIGLILGVSAITKSFKTEKLMYERDGYLMIASVLLLFYFSLNNRIGNLEAIAFLGFYVFYILFLFRSGDDPQKKHRFQNFIHYIFEFEYLAPIKNRITKIGVSQQKPQTLPTKPVDILQNKSSLLKDSLIVLISIAAIIFGAKYLIEEAVWLAQLLQLPESLIGLSLIAVGTSLPELIVSIKAVRLGKGELVIGNVLGSNIANIALILGVSGSIAPMEVSELTIIYIIPIVLFFSLALLYFIRSDWRIGRRQGFVALFAYVIFLVFAILNGLE